MVPQSKRTTSLLGREGTRKEPTATAIKDIYGKIMSSSSGAPNAGKKGIVRKYASGAHSIVTTKVDLRSATNTPKSNIPGISGTGQGEVTIFFLSPHQVTVFSPPLCLQAFRRLIALWPNGT